jgi:hypothetical protein
MCPVANRITSAAIRNATSIGLLPLHPVAAVRDSGPAPRVYARRPSVISRHGPRIRRTAAYSRDGLRGPRRAAAGEGGKQIEDQADGEAAGQAPGVAVRHDLHYVEAREAAAGGDAP